MNPMVMMVVAVLIFVAVFGGILALAQAIQRKQQLAVADGVEDTAPAGTGPLSPAEVKTAALTEKLRLAGMKMEPELFQKRVVMVAMTLAAVGMVMGGFSVGGMLFAGLLGVAALKGGDFFLAWKQGQRMQDFTDQFSDALGVMANGVKSGQTVIQTLETLVADFTDPLREEVAEVLQELRMGVPMDEALTHWVQRVPSEDLEIAVTALVVQRQTGGNISEILETLADTIRERNKLHKQIKALTSQGRMSGWVMALLPVGIFLAMYLIAPARMSLLLTHPIGLALTALSVGSIACGAWMIKKIVTIEV